MSVRLASDNPHPIPRAWEPEYYAAEHIQMDETQVEADERGRLVVFIATAFAAGIFACLVSEIVILMVKELL